MWHVDSVSGNNAQGYCVIRSQATPCVECISKGLICTATECNSLCIHMYRCDSKCYSFNNGHICKHIHRVHSLSHMTQQDTTMESTEEEPGGIEQYDSVDEDHVENNDIAEPSVVYAESVCNPQRGKLLYMYQ